MSSTPREIGTLVVIVLKANHLPNKRHIGKQDPYCVVTINGEKRRTKAIKRGGQHPEWDEEIRFVLYEDTEDVLARSTTKRDGTPPPPPPKDSIRRIKGGKTMKVACYADDIREPDLIGETDVDLTEVLTKGETDDWFTLSNKDKFAGKVYLELTFWSNEPPPEKKVTPKPPKNKQYGGPGSFVPTGDPSSRIKPGSIGQVNGRQPPDLYVAPYEQQNPVDKLARDFGEFGVNGGHRRRESYPVSTGYAQATYPPPPETSTGFLYDRSISPGTSGFYAAPPAAFPNPYEIPPHQSTIRAPRHSIPTTSSGFVPLQQASGFAPLQQENVGYGAPVSQTPAPMGYPNMAPQYVAQPAYLPPPQNQSPANSYLPSSTSSPMIYQSPQHTMSPSQSYPYPQYIPAAVSPPQQAPVPAPVASSTPAPGQIYQPYSSSPSLDPLPPNPPPPQTNNVGSRPLPPQPQVIYAPPPPMTQPQVIYAPPPPMTHSQSNLPPPPPPVNDFGPPPQGNVSPARSHPHPLPVPPPPPPLHYNTEPYGTEPQNYTNGTLLSNQPGPPPPPPPPRRRQASLPPPPPPPSVYQQSGSPYQQSASPQVDPYGYNNQAPLAPGVHQYQPGPPLPPPPGTDPSAHWTSYNSQ